MSLSTDQRAAFAENGWLVIRGAVESARVAALEAALDAVVPETQYALGYAGRVVEIASISRGSPERQARVKDDHVALELEPGDISIHHCLTFHGSHENPSARPRKTLAVRFVDGDARLVSERLPSPEMAVYFPTDPDGRLAERAFPLLHHER